MTTVRVSTRSHALEELIDVGLADEAAAAGDVGAQAMLTPATDVVLVPADELTAARTALEAGESLTPESLEDLLEGAPAAEELVHVVSPVDEVVLDEGQPMDPPSSDELEVAWVGDADEGSPPNARRG
jgi:hypothetical protein